MQIISQKELKEVGNIVTYDIKPFGGLYLYVDYTPGDETKISVTFKIRDKTHIDQTKMFNIISNGAIYSIDLISGKNVYPIPVPESADFLDIIFTATGDDADAIIDIFANGDIHRTAE